MRVYVGDDGGAVSAIDVLPGGGHKLAWTVKTGAQSYASVVTNGAGRVYTTSGSSLVAIDDHRATAGIAWRADPRNGQVEVSPGLAPDGTSGAIPSDCGGAFGRALITRGIDRLTGAGLRTAGPRASAGDSGRRPGNTWTQLDLRRNARA
jgi:hypothetical protein